MKLLGLNRLWPPFGGSGTPRADSFLAAVRARILDTLADVSQVYLMKTGPRFEAPCVIMNVITTVPTIGSTSGYWEEITMQFTVISHDALEAQRIGEQIRDQAFPKGGTRLRFYGGYEMGRYVGRCWMLPSFPRQGPLGKDIWGFTVQVVFLIGRESS